MSVAFEHSSPPVRPHMKRGRHSTAPSSHSASLHRRSFGASSDDEYDGPHSAARVYPRLSYPPSASHSLTPPLPALLPSSSSYSSSASSCSLLDSTLYSPTTSPLSPCRDVSGCSAGSYSFSPLSSSQLASSSSPVPYSDLYQSPVQSLKRLCVNNGDACAESAAEEEPVQRWTRTQHILPYSHQQHQQQLLLSASSSLAHSGAGSRVLVRAKRTPLSSLSASVTPYQSQPSSRPSTASSSTLRPSFNLSEPSVDYHSSPPSLPANSAPTSTHASPRPSAATSPQTRYTSILSSSLPSGGQSFLSLLTLSCAAANSSFSSPAHSPSAAGFLSSSQHGTPSSAHSSASSRPHIMSAQERAALFPSRSVTSSPLPPDSQCNSSSSRRTSTGKRAGMDASSLTAASVDVSRRASDGGRHSKRLKEDRRRDRRRSIATSYSEQSDGPLVDDAADESDDMLLQLTLVPPTAPAHAVSRLSLVLGSSSNSLSSLDSPSSTSSYPRMSAPLNSPVSGSQGRRAGHIAADHLLGTAAAAASVARRRDSSGSLYEEEEQWLVEAVGAMQLFCEAGTMKQEEEEKELDETPPKLPAAPRLANRSTSLRLNLAAAISQPSHFPGESDSEMTGGDADDDSIVLSHSPLPSRQQSSPAEYYESFIPSTGSFSKVLRAQRQSQSQSQSQLFGSSSSSSSSSTSSPFPPSPVLSPLSPARPLHPDSFMSAAAAAVVIAPLSPIAFSSSSSSFSSLSSSLSGTLSSSFATGPPPSLSPFAPLPDYLPSFGRSVSHTVDRRRLPFGGGHHTGGGAEKRHTRVLGLSERERAGDGVGLDVPFLKELSLPPRGPGRRSAMS